MKASPESIKNTTVNTVFYAREDNSSVYSNKNTSCLTAERIYILYIILQFYYYYNFISFFFPTGAVRL